MKQFYLIVIVLLSLCDNTFAQPSNCSGFSATYSATESRCAGTGSILINATGGSGDYAYKILEPVASPLTSTSTITGLTPGTYTVYVKDMTTGCTLIQNNIVVTGAYSDPRFQLIKTDVTCSSGSDGSISVANQQFGRNPFTYTIIAPSPAAVGAVNSTGAFTNLIPGQYFVQLRDSCGGIQTRSIIIDDYTWSITGTSVTKSNCTTVAVVITLLDNKGNSNLSGTAFTGFSYGVINAPGDTIWNASSSFSYSKSPLRTLNFVIKDRCGNRKLFSWQNPVPQISASATLSNYACNSFSAKLTVPVNLTSPQYYLKQGVTTIANNTTGQFDNVPYGNYCLEVKDACYDTIISRCINVPKPLPAVAASLTYSNYSCNTFTVAVTGQANLFNPQYCLYDNTNTVVSCGTAASFSNVPYGSYTVRIRSQAPCYDTTISRPFTLLAPTPSAALLPTYTNQTCSSFDASITTTNLFNGNFCLYDNNNVLIGCNGTGTFTGLSYGSYCMKITSVAPCYDIIINRCFTVGQPQPGAGDPSITNRTCTNFSVTIPSVSNIPSPQYCLYDNAHNLVSCGASSTFNNISYGSYCIEIATTSTSTTCPATTVSKCFAVTRLIPSVAADVTLNNKVCATFGAAVTGQTNLINPTYKLYDNNNNLLSSGSSATFNSLTYGSYRIEIVSGCGDTTIKRNFAATGPALGFSLTAAESCTLNTTNIAVNISSGQAPYVVKVLNPFNAVIATQTFSTASYTFTNLPALGGSLQYKVAVNTACNQNDTLLVTPKPSVFARIRNIVSKCPSGQSENGSGNLTISLTSNLGQYTPQVIKKNGLPAVLNPTTVVVVSPTQKNYGYADLDPATYIIEYNLTTCSQKLYDTVVVTAYQYPDLQNSAGYQCDNNNFSVSAVANHGVAPFSYEIIGSNPTGPSIVTAVQSSSVFNINTSSAYSLVRMRAIDACGNGTLNDVSVLPLGQLHISINNIDCFSNNMTLSVDTIPNATYTWYRRTGPADSVLIHSEQAYNIPYLLPTDTGIYICKTLVNGGCLTRLSYYDLHGGCSMILPVRLTSFTGRLSKNSVPLTWTTEEEKDIREYMVQRFNAASGIFETIATVKANNKQGKQSYSFTDMILPGGVLQYKLKMVSSDGKAIYSDIVFLTNEGVYISAGPNPVKNLLKIQINTRTAAAYEVTLINLAGQLFFRQLTGTTPAATLTIQRSNTMKAGLYMVKVVNLANGETYTRKLIYE